MKNDKEKQTGVSVSAGTRHVSGNKRVTQEACDLKKKKK